MLWKVPLPRPLTSPCRDCNAGHYTNCELYCKDLQAFQVELHAGDPVGEVPAVDYEEIYYQPEAAKKAQVESDLLFPPSEWCIKES